MRIKKGFVLREMCGETIVSAESIDNIDFNRLISLNGSAAYLWRKVDGREFDADLLASLLTEKYDVDPQTALHDAQKLCESWTEAGVTE